MCVFLRRSDSTSLKGLGLNSWDCFSPPVLWSLSLLWGILLFKCPALSHSVGLLYYYMLYIQWICKDVCVCACADVYSLQSLMLIYFYLNVQEMFQKARGEIQWKMSIVPAAESVQVSPDSWAGPCPHLLHWLLMSWGLQQQSALLTYITLMVTEDPAKTVWGEPSVGGWTWSLPFSAVIFIFFKHPAARDWFQHACIQTGVILHTCHVANNTVGTQIDSCSASHTQLSVSARTQSFLFFYIYVFVLQLSTGTFAKPPAPGPLTVTKRFQLWQAATVAALRGPCPPTPPLHTQEPLL